MAVMTSDDKRAVSEGRPASVRDTSFAGRVSDTPNLVIRMSAKLQGTGRYGSVLAVTAKTDSDLD